MYSLYKITNKINNKVYIGITKRTLSQRFNTHVYDAKNYTHKLANSIKKYGRDNFKIELLEEIESKEGRLRYLDDQVAYSTLHIRLFNEKEYIYEPQQQGGFIEKVKRSLSYGWIGIVEFTVWMISLWPIVLLVPLLIVIIKRIRKKRKISARKE